MTAALPPTSPAACLPEAAGDAICARPVDEAMAHWARSQPALPLAVAFSGGADSSALLAACAQHWPGQVYAWHVHHGLQAAADDFERHCVDLCARLGVALQVRRIAARNAPGESPEAAARRARYAALDDMAEQNTIRTVTLGHHADDQVETLLLALSRGAGIAGLAGMPRHWQRGAVHYVRPLLDVPAASTRAWLRLRGLPWVEDPSNTDARYTRNRIRALVLPALEAAFPQFRQTFARSAAHAAQARALLQDMGAQDLLAVGNPPQLAALRALARPRQANVLRHWLAASHATTPSAAQLGELLDQIEACATRGHRLMLRAGAGLVRRDGEVLQWSPRL